MTDKEKRIVVEDMLLNYDINKREIESIKLDIEELDHKDIGSVTYEERTGPTNKVSNAIEDNAIAKDDKKRKLRSKIRYLEIQNEKIDNALKILTETEKELIDYRYFEFKARNLNYIAEKVGYTKQYTCKIIKRALDKMARMIIIV